MGQICSYDGGGRKRGLPTGYVKSLELLFGLIFTAVPNGEKVVSNLLTNAQFTLEPGGKFSLTSRLAAETDTPRIAWNESQVQQELDRRLKHLDASGEDEETLESDAGNIQSAEAFETSVPAFEETPTPSATGLSSSSIQGGTRQLPDNSNDELRRFPEDSRRLLDQYFSYTHCWLPLVEKHKLFQVLFSTADVGIPESSGNLAVFWAVIAYASVQEQQRQETTAGNSPNQSLQSPLSDRAYGYARRLIPDEDQAASTGHVQALIVMSLCRIRRGALKPAWRLLGHAVRMCLGELALPDQTSAASQSNASPSSSQRHRLLLACFALDTFLSCRIGAPPHLRSSDIASLRPLDESGPDEWDPWIVAHEQHDSSRIRPLHGVFEPLRAASFFNNWVLIACVLNDAISRPSASLNTSSLAKLGAGLQRCRDQLPAHCKPPSLLGSQMDDSQLAPAWSPQLLNLHLALTFTENWIAAAQADHSAPAGMSEQLDLNSTFTLLRSIETSPEAWMLPPLVTCYKFPRRQASLAPRTSSAQAGCLRNASKFWGPRPSFTPEEQPTGSTQGRTLSNMNTGLTPMSTHTDATTTTQNSSESSYTL